MYILCKEENYKIDENTDYKIQVWKNDSGVTVYKSRITLFRKNTRWNQSTHYITLNHENDHKNIFDNILGRLEHNVRLAETWMPRNNSISGTILSDLYANIANVKRFAKSMFDISFNNLPACNCCGKDLLENPIEDKWGGYICTDCQIEEN